MTDLTAYKTPTRFSVIFIDDEPFYADPYVRTISEVFQVHFFRDANAANVALKEVDERTFVIVDVMMPSPSLEVIRETEDGQVTGLWLLSIHRDRLKALNVPILVLTNKDLDMVGFHLEDMGLQGLDLKIRAKFTVSTELLLSEIQEAFRKRSEI